MAEDSNSGSFGTWTRYFDDISRFLDGAERQYGIANANFCEYVLERLEVCIDTCSSLRDHMVTGGASGDEDIIEEYRSNLECLVECLRWVQGKWLEYEDIVSIGAERFRFRYEVERTVRGRGRPQFNISKEQLLHLSSLNFTWSEIASLLGVSRMTIYRFVQKIGFVHYQYYMYTLNVCRRRAEFEMLDDSTSTITDAELSAIIDEIHSESPTLGITLVTGRLRSMGYQVSRERIRCALRASDPLSSALRWTGALSRRQPYSVAGPNSLWHIGNNIHLRLTFLLTDMSEFHTN